MCKLGRDPAGPTSQASGGTERHHLAFAHGQVTGVLLHKRYAHEISLTGNVTIQYSVGHKPEKSVSETVNDEGDEDEGEAQKVVHVRNTSDDVQGVWSTKRCQWWSLRMQRSS